MKKVIFKIEGIQPLMLNNPQTVNPFNEYTKALKPLTSKRKKTDEDFDQMYRLHFESSLYVKNGVYIIPGEHFWKSVCTAAKEQKMGKKFEQSFFIAEDCVLDFPEKNLSIDELYEEKSHVDIRDAGIKANRIPACRAIFPEWKTTVECYFDETQIDYNDVVRFFEISGSRYGVGTYRLKFGRFKATELK